MEDRSTSSQSSAPVLMQPSPPTLAVQQAHPSPHLQQAPSSSGTTEFLTANCPLIGQLSLAMFAGLLGLVTIIIEAIGLTPGNASDDTPDWSLSDGTGPVGPGFGGGILALSTGGFAASILVQSLRLKSYQRNVLHVATGINCQVTTLTNLMGFMSASLVVAASCSAVYYEYFPGLVNCVILAIMAVIMFVGSIIGCCVACSANCGGCCSQCCVSPNTLSAGYQPLINTFQDEESSYGTFHGCHHQWGQRTPYQPMPLPGTHGQPSMYGYQTARATGSNQTNTQASHAMNPPPGHPPTHGKPQVAVAPPAEADTRLHRGQIPVAEPVHGGVVQQPTSLGSSGSQVVAGASGGVEQDKTTTE